MEPKAMIISSSLEETMDGITIIGITMDGAAGGVTMEGVIMAGVTMDGESSGDLI